MMVLLSPKVKRAAELGGSIEKLLEVRDPRAQNDSGKGSGSAPTTTHHHMPNPKQECSIKLWRHTFLRTPDPPKTPPPRL
jgi:hypothetical protein